MLLHPASRRLKFEAEKKNELEFCAMVSHARLALETAGPIPEILAGETSVNFFGWRDFWYYPN